MPVHKGFPEGPQPLWTPALEAIHLSAFWYWPNGWRLNVLARRQGETFENCRQDVYEFMSTDELISHTDTVLTALFESSS